jgi:hypothetical protein
MRSFDPHAVGTYECRAWETYYRRRWAAFLAASVGMVRSAFRMSWRRTLVGAWLVLRANMKWAPFPDNDPDGARALMRRFYEVLAASEGARFDVGPVGAGRLRPGCAGTRRGARAARPLLRRAARRGAPLTVAGQRQMR